MDGDGCTLLRPLIAVEASVYLEMRGQEQSRCSPGLSPLHGHSHVSDRDAHRNDPVGGLRCSGRWSMEVLCCVSGKNIKHMTKVIIKLCVY